MLNSFYSTRKCYTGYWGERVEGVYLAVNPVNCNNDMPVGAITFML